MSINKIEIQDGGGNVYYPKTSIDSVIYSDNTSIEEKIQILEYKLNELKSQLADSINNKTGSSLTSNSTVDEMAAIINSIKTLEQATADANATASNILVDKTAYVNGAKVTGTMPNHGTVTKQLAINETFALGEGHINSLTVTQNIPLLNPNWNDIHETDQTKVGQHMYNNGANYALLKVPNGHYINGCNWVGAYTPDLKSENIVAGKNILGVGGSATIQSLGGFGRIDISDAMSTNTDESNKGYYYRGDDYDHTHRLRIDKILPSGYSEVVYFGRMDIPTSGNVKSVPFVGYNKGFQLYEREDSGAMHWQYTNCDYRIVSARSFNKDYRTELYATLLYR